jgi:hypothetical protein
MAAALALAGCAGDDGDDGNASAGGDAAGAGADAGPTYYSHAKPIIDARCVSCHQPGDIGPFSLTSHEEVSALAALVRKSIEDGTMPPWQPDDSCREYLGNFDLRPDEKTTLLAWLDAGAPAGDPNAAPAVTIEDNAPSFEPNLMLQLPEPYAPKLQPDDYHCQLIPWPADKTKYVTGLRVSPDKSEIVHHVIVFVVGPDQVEQYKAYDDAEDGPGYTCYGGPAGSSSGGLLSNVDPAEMLKALQKAGLSLVDVRSGNITQEQLAALLAELDLDGLGGFANLGSWVPGTPSLPLPEGTGLKVEPGSMLVVQMHYNSTMANPPADQSTVELATVDSVDKQAALMPLLDLGWVSDGLIGDAMTIPAGQADVQHAATLPWQSVMIARARQTLGLSEDDRMLVYRAEHHMHELGVQQRTELHHADGSVSCLLDIPRWDFAWQGSYRFAEPISFGPGDSIWMGCSWDNSEANQPFVNGQRRAPVEVSWGEGTSDEMCLGSLYVTAE